MSKQQRMTVCRNCGASMVENAKICPQCGAKNKKPFRKGIGLLVLIIIIAVVALGTCGKKKNTEKDKNIEYRWPTSELAGMLPQPESKYGKISMEREDYFSIDIYGTTSGQFEDYIEKCKEKGFTEDYSKIEDYYSAEDKAGFSLSLHYDGEEEEMNIMLSAPEKETQEPSSEPREETAAKPETEDGETAETAGEDDAEAAADDTEKPELTDGIRPEFKEAMDSYEAFMNEYCDFLERYAKSDGTDMKLLADYTDYVKKYTEEMEAFNAWDDGDMNAAEAAYYLEVQTRITKRLLEVDE